MNAITFKIIIFTVLLFSLSIPARAQELYVGTNYHPHDSKPEQWKKDIQLMKDAGFKVVRMGHLAWESYEPSDRIFDFKWFDDVMDMMDNRNYSA